MDESFLHGVFWNHLVYPELASDEMEDPGSLATWVEERLAGTAWPEFVACLVVDGLDAGEADQRRDAVRRVRSAIVETLPPDQCALIGFAHTNALYFCGRAGDREALRQRLDLLHQLLATDMSLPNSIGIAYLPETSVPALQWAAQHAIVAQRGRIRTGSHGVFVFDPDNFPRVFDTRSYWTLVQRMHSTVRSGDVIAAEALLFDLKHALFEETCLALQHLRPLLQSLVVFMAQAATEVYVDPVVVTEQSQSYLWQIGAAFDYGRLRQALVDATLSFTGLVHDRYASVRHKLAAEVDAYISQQFRDPDLSLHGIAQALGGSPSHISRTYKRVKGIALTRAINETRIVAAQRELLDTNNSITDVAMNVGFTNLQHFGRVFREITGQTPTQYRRANIG